MERCRYHRHSKTGKPRDLPASYRPISLLSSLGVQLALFADDTTLFLRSDSLNHIIPRLQRATNNGFNFGGLRDHIQRVRKLAIFYMSRLSGMIGRKSKMSLLNKRTLYTMCIRPVMTYACPVFVHAAPTALQDLQVIQNKFCRRATGAQWYVKNSVLHRDLELPTLSKYMKDASERFFSIAINHTNPLISAAASYEAPPENHFLRRPRNALSDPPDDLTAEVEELNKALENLME
ncbi:Probable RNA-directed DNA polymerase from transposon X-element [Eumeta japonica]|uniref:Probable RNA-directed DNA polymerase from transposon X-element n=1 Tax=Eumeta variegata TaxID=151549 RepID=A0A4C1ZXC4_EUMVA|nr:Probable RNA-directed DNA polymerase from transposon X-element [Eumeta japonica]